MSTIDPFAQAERHGADAMLAALVEVGALAYSPQDQAFLPGQKVSQQALDMAMSRRVPSWRKP